MVQATTIAWHIVHRGSERIGEFMNKKINQYKYQVEFAKKFKGYYLYFMKCKITGKSYYVGYATNIYRRYMMHYRTTAGTKFAEYCTEHGLNQDDFEMLVLDLTYIAGEIEFDVDDLMLLESYMIQVHNQDGMLINKQKVRKSLTIHEIERLEQLLYYVDMGNFEPVQKVIQNKYQEHEKNLSIATNY